MLVIIGVKVFKEEVTKKKLNEGKIIPRGYWHHFQLKFNPRILAVILIYQFRVLHCITKEYMIKDKLLPKIDLMQ